MIFLSTPFFGKILKDGLLGKIFSPAPLQNAGGCATIGVAKTCRRDPARRDIHIILPIWGKSLYVAALTAYAMGVFCFLTCFSGKRAKAIRILFWRLSLSFFFRRSGGPAGPPFCLLPRSLCGCAEKSGKSLSDFFPAVRRRPGANHPLSGTK